MRAALEFQVTLYFIALILLISGVKGAKAEVIAVTNFTEIDGASFIDLPGSDNLGPITFDSLVITSSEPLATGSFASFPTGGPDDPADGNGYFATTTGIGVRLISSITLDFSSPLAAFGVTFHHFPPERNMGNDAPALLQVFDGPNGSGNLLGSIRSSGLLTSDPGGNPDFVAIWSDALNIQSATLTGTGPSKGFAVDGYALSFTLLSMIEVTIDIKPRSFPNIITPQSQGMIPVAILSDADFDAPVEVETSSLRFGRTGDEASLAFCRPSPEDVNRDGLLDLVCHFTIPQTGFQAGDTAGVLKGQTVDGNPLKGADSVRIVP